MNVISFEFENISQPSKKLPACVRCVRGEVLHICQNREREKEFLVRHGFPHAPFAVVDSSESLSAALNAIGTPSVLKTADFGYDGKGQLKLEGVVDPKVSGDFNASRGILEKWISFQGELSVIVARGLDGSMVPFPPSENLHKHHPGSLDCSGPISSRSMRSGCPACVRDRGLARCCRTFGCRIFLNCDGELW